MVEKPDWELETVEDYNEYQKWAQSLPQEERVKLIVDSFEKIMGGKVFIACSPKQDYKMIVVFKDKGLLEGIMQEMNSRQIYMPDYTDAERVEKAKVQLSLNDPSVALASILTALMSELGADFAATWEDHLEDLTLPEGCDCMMIFQDVKLAFSLLGKEVPEELEEM